MNARISKRKQAHPIQAPPSLGYTDVEMERAARKPRYIDITLALRCQDAGLWTHTMPSPSRKQIVKPDIAYIQNISLVNARSARRSVEQPISPPARAATRLGARSKSNNTNPIGRDPSGQVPDTPSSLLPRNTIPSYAKKAIREAAAEYQHFSFQPYPGATPMSRRNSSTVRSRREGIALQRANSGDSMPGFAGGPMRRGSRVTTAVNSRAASPAPIVAWPAVLQASAGNARAQTEESDVTMDEDESEVEEELGKAYRPPRQQRKKQSPGAAGESEAAPSQPKTRSSARLTRSTRGVSAVSGSEYDSDASIASAGPIATATKGADQRQTLPVPLVLAKPASIPVLDNLSMPRSHSPLSQTFAPEDTDIHVPTAMRDTFAQALAA